MLIIVISIAESPSTPLRFLETLDSISLAEGDVASTENLNIDSITINTNELLSSGIDSVNPLIAIPNDRKINASDLSVVYTPSRCSGKCKVIDMNFPPNNYFMGRWNDWSVSNGTPTVYPNSIWMWSYKGIGEGMNLDHPFVKGNNYCIESLLTLTHGGNAAIHSQSYANMVLTKGPQYNSLGALGTPIISPSNPHQSLLRQNYSAVSTPYTNNYVINFTANDNYSTMRIYPEQYSAPPQITMQLTKLIICEQEKPNPCNFNIRIRAVQTCSFVKVYPYSSLAQGLSVEGYIWNFGDGAESRTQFAEHVYAQPGNYIITLTVLVKNNLGECCTKKFRYFVHVDYCSPCDLIRRIANIVMTPLGSLVKYEPNLPSNGNYLYKWVFPGNVVLYSREVYRSVLSENVSLTISYAGSDCCSRTVFRRIYYDPVYQLATLYPFNAASAVSIDESLRKVDSIVQEDQMTEVEVIDAELEEIGLDE